MFATRVVSSLRAIVAVTMLFRASAECESLVPQNSLIRDATCAGAERNVSYVVVTNEHHRDIFLRMFRNVPHCVAHSFTVICMDDASFAMCQQDNASACVRSYANASPSDFLKGDYNKFIYQYKYSLIRDILQQNRTVFWIDNDVALFRLPRSRVLSRRITWWYQAEFCTHGLNGGVMIVRPTPANTRIAQEMCIANDSRLDQELLQHKLLENNVSNSVLPRHYRGACCDGCSKKDRSNTVTFHAHCKEDVASKLSCLDTALAA